MWLAAVPSNELGSMEIVDPIVPPRQARRCFKTHVGHNVERSQATDQVHFFLSRAWLEVMLLPNAPQSLEHRVSGSYIQVEMMYASPFMCSVFIYSLRCFIVDLCNVVEFIFHTASTPN
jgi:hypothetical protein